MARRAKTGQDEPALRLTIVRHRSPPHKIDPIEELAIGGEREWWVVLFGLVFSGFRWIGLVVCWEGGVVAVDGVVRWGFCPFVFRWRG